MELRISWLRLLALVRKLSLKKFSSPSCPYEYGFPLHLCTGDDDWLRSSSRRRRGGGLSALICRCHSFNPCRRLPLPCVTRCFFLHHTSCMLTGMWHRHGICGVKCSLPARGLMPEESKMSKRYMKPPVYFHSVQIFKPTPQISSLRRSVFCLKYMTIIDR